MPAETVVQEMEYATRSVFNILPLTEQLCRLEEIPQR
jgi:hypothetical protein